MMKPNFLIVGAAKSGSTSLYHYLCQHPEVFMPDNKEPNYFVAEYQRKISSMCPAFENGKRRFVLNGEAYFDLFSSAVPGVHKAIGEATVTYLYKPEIAIPKIKENLGDPKILMILRNPIDRCISQYQYCREMGFEDEELSKAFSLERRRIDDGWSSIFAYVDQGMYAQQVRAYLDNFSKVKVLLLDDFLADKQGVMKGVYDFLDIDNTIINDFSEKLNASGVPRWRWVHNLIMRQGVLKSTIRQILSVLGIQKSGRKVLRFLRRVNQKSLRTDVPREMRHHLGEVYRDDIKALGLVLGREDLQTIWSENP